MKTSKKLLSLLLALVLALSCAAVAFAENTPAVVASGDCGADGGNLQWELYSDGTLNITGEGAMADYGLSQANYSPWIAYYTNYWNDYYDAIAQNLGYANLEELENAYVNGQVSDAAIAAAEAQLAGTIPTRDEIIKTVSIGEGVTSIGNLAFYLCRATTISLPSTLKSIGDHAFDTASFTELALPEGLETIGDWAFCSLPVKELTIPASVTALGSDATGGIYYLEKLTILNPDLVIDDLLVPCVPSARLTVSYDSYEAYRVDYPTYDVQPVNSPINNRFTDSYPNNDDAFVVVPWLTIQGSCTGAAKEAAERANIKFEAMHNWSAWATVQAASPTASGLETRTCSKCNATEENVLPATGVPEEPTTEPTTQPTQPSDPQPSGDNGGNFFQAILNAIRAFFQRIGNFFRNLF